MPAGRVLVVVLVALVTWMHLRTDAEARGGRISLGIRRTVSLALLSPIAAVSDFVGVDELAGRSSAPRGGCPERRAAPSSRRRRTSSRRAIRSRGPTATATAGTTTREPRPSRTRSARRRRPAGCASRSSGTRSPPGSATSPSACSPARPRLRPGTHLDRPRAAGLLQLAVHDAADRPSLRPRPRDRDARGERPSVPPGRPRQPVGTTGTAAWPAEYRDRVLQMMRIGTSEGAKVIWGPADLLGRPPP